MTSRDPSLARQRARARERAASPSILADGRRIQSRHLSSKLAPDPSGKRRGSLAEQLESLKLAAVRDALGKVGGNRSRAAAALCIDPYSLRRMMKRFKIR